MYLGEVTRNLVLYLVDNQVIFSGHSARGINDHYGLDTAIMSALEASSVPSAKLDPITSVRKVILEDFKIPTKYVEDEDCIAVARVSEIVGTRGARLAACALAAVVKQTGRDVGEGEIKIGVDGSLMEFYPRFTQRIRQALREVLGEKVEKRIVLSAAKDGSGVGGQSRSHLLHS